MQHTTTIYESNSNELKIYAAHVCSIPDLEEHADDRHHGQSAVGQLRVELLFSQLWVGDTGVPEIEKSVARVQPVKRSLKT